ncbi:MAG TPA: shikimate kinase [Afifellaceae bacterium]|nr:shikimate kinase [Afifellaceae bacterium]
MAQAKKSEDAELARRIVERLGRRNIVLVGMMGAGKTSVGRRLASELGLDFVDADKEIESAANMTVSEIFAIYGEEHFRDGERRVIARLLADGRKVVATGGGAFMSAETRERIAESGISLWLRAELPVLLDRVRRRGKRPLLHHPDPERVMRDLLARREPVYAQADITVDSWDTAQRAITHQALVALDAHLCQEACR